MSNTDSFHRESEQRIEQDIATRAVESCNPQTINPSNSNWEICLQFTHFDPNSAQFREDMLALQNLSNLGVATFYYFTTTKTIYLKPLQGSNAQDFPPKILEIFRKSEYQVLAVSARGVDRETAVEIQQDLCDKIEKVLEAKASGPVLDFKSGEIFDYTSKEQQLRTFDFNELIVTIEFQNEYRIDVLQHIVELAERESLRFETVVDHQNTFVVVRFYRIGSMSYDGKEMSNESIQYITQHSYVVGMMNFLA